MTLRILVAAILGSLCGSFAAVIVDRTPRGESAASGRSRCRACDRHIAVRDLVPVVSWLVLRGRCRRCGASIGASPFVIEVLTAAVFTACAVRIQDSAVLVAHWILCTGLMALSVIDVFTLRLPRRIIHVTALFGSTALVSASVSSGETERLVTAAAGAVAALVVMTLLYVASRGRLGDGDVRLSPLLGLYLGWKDMTSVHAGLLLAFVLGSLVGLGLIAVSRAHRSTAIPFGPFLAMGTMAALLFDIDLLG